MLCTTVSQINHHSPLESCKDPEFAFDIGDDDMVSLIVERVSTSLNVPKYLGVIPYDGEPYGIVVYQRGSAGYYRKYIAPRLEMLRDVVDKLCLLDYFPVLFTFTTATNFFASQTGAWFSVKENRNRVLSWARKGAVRSRRYRVNRSLFQLLVQHYARDPSRFVVLDEAECSIRFCNVRPRIRLYLYIPEDTEARYPAPHCLFFFDGHDFTDLPMTRNEALRLFNDELTCICEEQGFTKISEVKSQFIDASSAMRYITKYIVKQMNPDHPGYDVSRGITWMVCLRSVGCRMFSMSNGWRDAYRNLHAVTEVKNDRVVHPHKGVNPLGRSTSDLNNINSDNSNEKKNLCHFFDEAFRNVHDFMLFFHGFLRSLEPPLDGLKRIVIGFTPLSSDLPSEYQVVKGKKKTVPTIFTFSDDYIETNNELVPYLFRHCKICPKFSECPRKTCFQSVECVYCCCADADIAVEEQKCYLAQEVFPHGYLES